MPAYDLTSVDSEAVCMDGSPAKYYFVPATVPSQNNIWLLYLEGGDWCFDEFSCQSREKNAAAFTSSSSWPSTQKLGGIFETNPTKTPFAHVNKVYIGYCSSDAYVGNAGPSAETFGYYFRGQKIVEATLQAMVQTHGMGTRGMTERLLFGGCSAGARGASFTLDYVPGIITGFGGSNVQVQGMLDSSLWLDVQPYSPSLISLQCQVQAITSFINATGRMDASCLQQYPGSESWKCLFGQYRMPFLTLPYALNEAQFDSFQIDSNMGWMNPKSPTQVSYAMNFRQDMINELDSLPTSSQTGSGVYSSACLHHCVTNEESFWGLQVEGISFAEALGWWFFGGGPYQPLQERLIETCDGYRCGSCSAKHSRKGGKLKVHPPPAYSWHWGMPPAPAAPMPAVCGGPYVFEPSMAGGAESTSPASSGGLSMLRSLSLEQVPSKQQPQTQQLQDEYAQAQALAHTAQV